MNPTLQQKQAAYLAFLQTKIPHAELAGIEPPCLPHGNLKPHQVDICQWAIRGGRRAVFAQFGLGKSRINLQLAAWVIHHCASMGKTGLAGKFLIVAPLGVRHQFTLEDGPAMGLMVAYVTCRAEAEASPCSILITNYERVRDGDLDPALFAGASLDEASVLRSYGSKTYQEFLPKFTGVPFRFIFTATPSPNRYKELIHYAGFLGVMDTGEALTRFFARDSSEANNLTLYPHMEDVFWNWMMTWAVFIQSPSDLGYDATGYVLPPVTVHWHRLEIDHTAQWTVDGKHMDGWGQGQLFVDPSAGLKEAAAVKRDSIDLRLAKVMELIGAEPDEHWLVWHDLENERREIEKHIPEAVTVWGSMNLEVREQRIQDFSHGKIQILATKPSLAGSGCNFQHHCARAIFMGIGYKFNDIIQAYHRIVRFLQGRQVEIHFIHLDTEDLIRAELEAKWRRHDEMVKKMTALLRKYKLVPDPADILQRAIGVVREERRAA
ncbi:MAG: hypothetical protein EBS21_02300 [Sphingomonadaceae bacterium]|nr:hypothetical protein [Sphingomonadaceae bacterium]